MMRMLGGIALAAALAAGPAGHALAGKAEEAIAKRVDAAYGKPSALRSLTIKQTVRTTAPGQGYSEDYVEFTTQKTETIIDYAGQRAASETWSFANGNGVHVRNVFDGTKGAAINYRNMNHRPDAFPDMHAVAGATIRSLDVALAREYVARAASAKSVGTQVYLNALHDRVEFTMPASPPITLFVNRQTGLISKAVREVAGVPQYFVFTDYRTQNGFTYAATTEQYTRKDVTLVSLSRTVEFNPQVADAAFAVDVPLEDARIDVSKMRVEKAADGVWHVGQEGAYTTFIDVGDYLVGVDGQAGLRERLAAFRTETKNQKPLRYQVVTHHHNDHLAGMGDARALGATFVALPNAIDFLRTAPGAAGLDLPSNRILVVNGKATLGAGDGRVELYGITTGHAERYLLVYLPTPRIAVAADHFGVPYVSYVPPGNYNLATYKAAIDALDLNPAAFLSMHNPGLRTRAEFEKAAATYDSRPCPSGRPICA